MKRIGPELRKPELRVPHFLSDLFYDLRDRRLLPLVALIVVAIIAVPFLLSAGAEEPVQEPQPIQGGPGASASSSNSSVTVVEAEPGLRNYEKRLAGRRSTNPFKQRFTGPVLREGVQSTEVQTEPTTTPTSAADTTVSVETETSTGTEPVASSPPPTHSPAAANPHSSEVGSSPSSGFYAFAINLQITKDLQAEDGTIERADQGIHKGVLPPTALPGKKAPVLTYIGVSTKTGAPLFVVSSEVASISGEGKCVGETGACQLIEIEPGLTATFVYGASQTRYTYKVLKVEPVAFDQSEITGESSKPSAE